MDLMKLVPLMLLYVCVLATPDIILKNLFQEKRLYSTGISSFVS